MISAASTPNTSCWLLVSSSHQLEFVSRGRGKGGGVFYTIEQSSLSKESASQPLVLGGLKVPLPIELTGVSGRVWSGIMVAAGPTPALNPGSSMGGGE